jgi:hypothetical protein
MILAHRNPSKAIRFNDLDSIPRLSLIAGIRQSVREMSRICHRTVATFKNGVKPGIRGDAESDAAYDKNTQKTWRFRAKTAIPLMDLRNRRLEVRALQ